MLLLKIAFFYQISLFLDIEYINSFDNQYEDILCNAIEEN